MSKLVVRNSDIFKQTLLRLCEVEASWNPAAVPGFHVANKILDGERTLGLEEASTFPCLPYRELLKRLKDAGFCCDKDDDSTGSEGRKAVLGLDRLTVSRFSTECVIDGLAHALQFESESNKRRCLKHVVAEIRNKEPLHKNSKIMEMRAVEMLTASMAVNPKAAAPYLLARRFDRWENGEEISAPEISGKARHDAHQFVYGCVRFPTDKLVKRPPSIELLVVANLNWVFTHWPVLAKTYPSAGRPPKKQPRGPRLPIEEKPHRDITAHFLNALFLQSDNLHTSVTVKNNFSLPDGAVFCGW